MEPKQNSPEEEAIPTPPETPASETGPLPGDQAPQPALAANPAPSSTLGGPAPSSTLAEPAFQPAPRSPFLERPGWLALGLAVLLSMVLSAALTLGVLAVANRGLSYASPADVKALRSQVQTLQGRIDAQDQDLAGLRARLDAVEKLAGRTTLLEQAASGLQSELDKRAADLDTLRSTVDSAQKQIEQVVTQSAAFDKFIAGLRGLLQNFQPSGSQKP